MSKPNKRAKKPKALINALPTPLVSFALVGISLSPNFTSLSQCKPVSVERAPASFLYIVQLISYPFSLKILLLEDP
jgi:hypothetical protein